MNAKERVFYLKETTPVGSELISANDGHHLKVTRITPFNAYLDGVRISWINLERLIHRGVYRFDNSYLRPECTGSGRVGRLAACKVCKGTGKVPEISNLLNP